MQFKRCANGEVYGFFGVFDGHGGSSAAEYVRDHLFRNIESNPHFPTDMETALSALWPMKPWRRPDSCFRRFCDSHP